MGIDSLNQKKQALATMNKKIDLRSAKTSANYREYLKNNKKTNCIYCDRELFVREFEYWIIIENRFPYDKISETTHMLATKRHVAKEKDLSDEEQKELTKIKENNLNYYDIIVQSTPSASSRPDHFHLHLMRYHRVSNESPADKNTKETNFEIITKFPIKLKTYILKIFPHQTN